MDVDQYPTGSRVDVYWAGDNEWYSASVIHTRIKSHTIDGEKTSCREILCYYDLDQVIKWHSVHENDIRECISPPPPDESGIDDPFPIGSRAEVWWSGESRWFIATVLTTRAVWHSIKRVRTLCREIFCYYPLDDHMQWHSLHNNKIRTVEGETQGTSRFIEQPPSKRHPCLLHHGPTKANTTAKHTHDERELLLWN